METNVLHGVTPVVILFFTLFYLFFIGIAGHLSLDMNMSLDHSPEMKPKINNKLSVLLEASVDHTSSYFVCSFNYFIVLFNRYSRSPVPGHEHVSRSQPRNETKNQEEIRIYQQEKTERTPDGKTTGTG